MFKSFIVVALALACVACVIAAPPAPGAPKDLNTASQLLYGYGGYAGVPVAYSGYGYGSPYYGSAVYYG